MPDLYQPLDLYAITSQVEGGRTSILESWAAGVRVVSTLAGMAADMIRHGENGVLAEVGGLESLLDGVASPLQSEDEKKKIRSNALADAQALDWRKVAATHLELFRTR